MPLTFSKRSIFSRNRVLFSLIIFGILIFIIAQMGFSAWLWGVSQPLLSPMTSKVREIKLEILDYTNMIMHLSDLKTENQKLRSKINIMSSKIVIVDDLIEENRLLRDQLGVLSDDDKEMILASVIQSDDNNYSDKLYLDAGSNDGVNIGDYAIKENVFLGKLIDVQENFSILQLLSDIDSIFPVRVESGESFANGVLNGELSKDSLKVGNIERDNEIENGAKVFLFESKRGVGTLSNFIIGSVEEIISEDASVYYELKVKPSIDYSDISDLFILTNK